MYSSDTEQSEWEKGLEVADDIFPVQLNYL